MFSPHIAVGVAERRGGDSTPSATSQTEGDKLMGGGLDED